ncbi:hypothetical protein NE237_020965 [Protea cynaroides]|uniref:Uncharacterized protein n=1 Tax=Protea cynaroides TaxID=273540 RepID=A0A9Q0K3X6_9MAGN|nr:hypothetical protein NE237_020965 [Protea cynaroides]
MTKKVTKIPQKSSKTLELPPFPTSPTTNSFHSLTIYSFSLSRSSFLRVGDSFCWLMNFCCGERCPRKASYPCPDSESKLALSFFLQNTELETGSSSIYPDFNGLESNNILQVQSR